MSAFRVRLVIPAAAALLLGISSTGFAQSELIGTRAGETVLAAIPNPAPGWGGSSQTIYKVSITDFRSDDSTFSLAKSIVSNVHFFQNAPANQSDWWAQAKLPSGAVIDSVELDACDTSATGEILFVLAVGAAGPGAGPGNVTPAGTTGLAATPGCAFFSVTPDAPPLIVNNQDFNYWVAVAWHGDFTNAVRAAGVRIRYRLQVSPAPGVATFSDVPTGYWAFQYIEALAASGITVGCAPGTFCPEDPVTRAQMAVFLSKALGLHWPK